ncbi:oligosaccharide flippase family protein [Candidatus Woesearchaeota archaeon]|nr:oligosaccharide flippase family protein [Candidatus Woesearchaeota archaeon]
MNVTEVKSKVMKKCQELTKGQTTSYLLKTFFIYGLISLSILLTRVLIARFYGIDSLGIFSYFWSLVTVVFLFASFGIPEALTQTIVKDPSKIYSTLKYWSIFSLPLTLLIILPLVFFEGYLPPGLILNFVLYLITYHLFYLSYSILRGYKRFFECSLFSLVNRLLAIFLIVISFLLGLPFNTMLLSFSLALLISAIWPMKQIISLIRLSSVDKNFQTISRISPTNRKLALKEFLGLSISLFLVQAGFYFLREVDMILIPHLLNFQELGIYSAHSSLTNIIRLIAYVFPVVVLPLAAVNKYKISTSLKKIIYLLIPFSLLILAATYWLVPLLYGKEYQSLWLPLVLVLSSSLLVIYSYFNSILAGENNFSSKYFLIIIIDFLISLILNTALIIQFIGWFGLMGAPLATGITVILKIIFNIYALNYLRRKNNVQLTINSHLKDKEEGLKNV